MLSPATRAKLLACLELATRAEFQGERDAAILGARRLLRSIGAEWDDVLKRPGEDCPALPHATWRSDLVLCNRYPHLLNDWERNFVGSISHQRQLTPKQRAALSRAADKIRAMGVPR